MPRRRVLAIGLDGYEQSLGHQLMGEDALPGLTALRSRSARFLLDHGAAARSGLAWEQVSSGQSPELTGRWSAVYFKTDSYQVWQEGTSLRPFAAALDARTVVFDPPYFDLHLAPSVRGVTNWGAHDPGVAFVGRPAELADEIHSRFGVNPAHDYMYDVVWPSADRTRELGHLLVQATEVRTRAAQWLLKERCPDWDFGFVVAGEIHSAIEAFWHGIDPTHPLHSVPSATEAADGLRNVYRATDALVSDLVSAFPDATVVAFSMGGMGPNRSDIASTVLLSELLYRNVFGRSLLRSRETWTNAPGGIPILDHGSNWSHDIQSQISHPTRPLDLARRAAVRLLPRGVRRILRRVRPGQPRNWEGVLRLPLDWMPTCLYQPYWHAMRFFALPSFYDGRVRINLAGREGAGMVLPADYETVCDEVESLVRECRDLRTGEPVVEYVERCRGRDPLTLGPTESDLVIVWRTAALGFEHPGMGRIGPLPYRRTGGHTGPFGMAYLAGNGIDAGDNGVRSSFDVVPTIIELLGEKVPPELSGRSLQQPAYNLSAS
jgi:predicted AlkP superfamily phosphohydrolase/phosphomutase